MAFLLHNFSYLGCMAANQMQLLEGVFEVICTGLCQRPEQIVSVAVQEDVDESILTV